MKTIPGFTSEATDRDGRVVLGILGEVLNGSGVFQHLLFHPHVRPNFDAERPPQISSVKLGLEDGGRSWM